MNTGYCQAVAQSASDKDHSYQWDKVVKDYCLVNSDEDVCACQPQNSKKFVDESYSDVSSAKKMTISEKPECYLRRCRTGGYRTHSQVQSSENCGDLTVCTQENVYSGGGNIEASDNIQHQYCTGDDQNGDELVNNPAGCLAKMEM
jgi:hypothetical protein